MPWVTKDGERTFEPRLPIPDITPPDPKAPWPDVEGAERLLHERAAFWKWWNRHLTEYFEFYLYCPRLACRRTKACRPDAPCHDEALEVLKAEFYPGFKKLLREMPPPPDEPAEAAPTGTTPRDARLSPLSPRKRGSRRPALRANARRRVE